MDSRTALFRLGQTLRLFAGSTLFGVSIGCGFNVPIDTPQCTNLLDGVTLDAGSSSPMTLRVGQQFQVVGTTGTPKDAEPPTENCPSQTHGKTYFPRVEWRYPDDSPFDVALTSCPCTVEYERDDNNGYHVIVARASGPGVFLFELTGKHPGEGQFFFYGYVADPCRGAPGQPIAECGPSSGRVVGFRVTQE
jgi:hypothetical protein